MASVCEVAARINERHERAPSCADSRNPSWAAGAASIRRLTNLTARRAGTMVSGSNEAFNARQPTYSPPHRRKCSTSPRSYPGPGSASIPALPLGKLEESNWIPIEREAHVASRQPEVLGQGARRDTESAGRHTPQEEVPPPTAV